jgi:hypothetical protein
MIRIGAAIMHHPRRADRLPGLIRGCAPLTPAVVTDPDPTGRPSPLRTAKRAWSRIEPGATHHLVLQDDVRPVPGFAAQLQEAVRHRPAHGVSLFCLWHTPHNSYLVRRAAVAGASYAPLSLDEWTPTQGFVLPVPIARELAEHLAGIPDEVQDDDEMIVIFCRERGIPVVATVPHLMDHGHERSLVGGHLNGLRAAVLAPGHPWQPPASRPALPSGPGLPPEQSDLPSRHTDPPRGSPDPATDPDLPPGHYAVELAGSVCSIRPMHGDAVEHQFPWYWYDACPLTGLDPEAILDAAVPHLPAAPPPVLTEVWAAGYLIAADVARHRPGLRNPGPLTAAALESWIDQGLAPEDRALRTTCLRLAMTAVHQALRDARRTSVP